MNKLMILFTLALFYACVPVKKLQDEQAKSNKLQLENQALMEELQKMGLLKANMEEEIDSLKKHLKALKTDSISLTEKYRSEKKKNDDLNKLYDDLVSQ